MAQRRFFINTRFLWVAFLAVLAGCGGGGAQGDGFKGARGEVSGTITLDGKPLQKGCQVIFMSKEGGHTATGVVDEQGKYTLSYTGGNGLPVGEYLVQLSAPVVISEQKGPVDPRAMADKMKLAGKPGEATTDSNPFPNKYLTTTNSKLTFTVAAGKNTANFELTK